MLLYYVQCHLDNFLVMSWLRSKQNPLSIFILLSTKRGPLRMSPSQWRLVLIFVMQNALFIMNLIILFTFYVHWIYEKWLISFRRFFSFLPLVFLLPVWYILGHVSHSGVLLQLASISNLLHGGVKIGIYCNCIYFKKKILFTSTDSDQKLTAYSKWL